MLEDLKPAPGGGGGHAKGFYFLSSRCLICFLVPGKNVNDELLRGLDVH